jgi:drug/metabolite transporter (DMT)-like permease
MQQPQTWPIILNLIAALFGAAGQWLYKSGSGKIGQIAIYKNWQIFLGMGLFCIVMLLFVVAFKMGGKLSVTYPVYATTFIWGMMLAVWADQEPWSWLQIVGISLIVLGVSFVAAFAPKA